MGLDVWDCHVGLVGFFFFLISVLFFWHHASQFLHHSFLVHLLAHTASLMCNDKKPFEFFFSSTALPCSTLIGFFFFELSGFSCFSRAAWWQHQLIFFKIKLMKAVATLKFTSSVLPNVRNVHKTPPHQQQAARVLARVPLLIFYSNSTEFYNCLE